MKSEKQKKANFKKCGKTYPLQMFVRQFMTTINKVQANLLQKR